MKIKAISTIGILILSLALAICWSLTGRPETALAAPEACVAGPHSGTISSDQEWCVSDNPHYVTGSVTVNAGVTLTIYPGVIVYFNSGTNLSVNGTLIAEGTIDQPIVLSSPAGTPQPGDWGRISAEGSSVLRMAYCDVGYGGTTGIPYHMIYSSQTSDVQIRHCRIHHSLGMGVFFNDDYLSPVLEDVEIDHNGSWPVQQTHISMTPTYTNLRFHDNPIDALSIGNTHVVIDVTLDGSPAALNGAPIYYPGGSIYTGNTLTLTPGTTLKIGSGGSLSMATGAALIAEGTSDLPVTITSQQADPQPGDWGKIYAEGSAVLRMAYCDVGYGGTTGIPYHMIYSSQTSDVQIRHCRIHHSLGMGVFFNDDYLSPVLEDVEIDHNGSWPVQQTHISMTPTYTNLRFHDNYADALSINGGHLTLQLTLDSLASLNGKAIVFQGPITVDAGGKLTLNPGTIIKLNSNNYLIVNGQLDAAGSAANPVVFTSYADDAYGGDTNHDGNASQPAPGDWYRISIDGGTANFNHALVLYGAGSTAVSGALVYTSGAASLTVANSLLSEGLYSGLLMAGGSTTISNSLVTATDRGICAHPSSQVNVINSTVDGNRIGLLLHGGTLNAANTLVSNNLEYGFLYDYGSPNYTIRYSDFWNPGAANYGGIPDQTGSNGNISADPLYKDLERGNYRLDYVSPAIDSADGALAPETDFMGAPRYDDPRTPNTGQPTGSGAYADMGAFEFVEDAPSNINLVVTQVEGPSAAVAGELSYVSWTVANTGSESAAGPWRDRISLTPSGVISPSVLYAGESLVGEGIVLAAGESYQASAWVRVPGGAIGAYHWQVDTNTHQDIFEGANRFDNTALSQSQVALDLPALLPDAAPLSRIFSTSGQAHWFKLTPQAAQDSLILLDTASSEGAVEMLLGEGFMPSPEHYTLKQVETGSPDVSAFVPAGGEDIWYILVCPEYLPGDNIGFTIQATGLEFELIYVSPDSGGNIGTVTFLIYGGELEADDLFELIAPDGVHLAADWILPINSALVKASFNLAGLATGSYDLSVSAPGGGTAVLNDAIEVVTGIEPQVWVDITGPNNVRAGDQATYQVQFGNLGNVDATMPDLHLYLPSGVSLDWLSDEAVLYSLDPIAGTHEIAFSQPGLAPNSSSSILLRTVNPLEPGDMEYDAALIGMPAVPDEVEPWSAAEITQVNEFISATETQMQVVAHVSDGTTSGDLNFELQVEESPVAVPVTITLTESDGMQYWYYEMTEPAGSVPMLDTLSPRVDWEKVKGYGEGLGDLYEKVKYAYEKWQAFESLKAANRRRISQEQINNCLFHYRESNINYLLDKGQRIQLNNSAKGGYSAVIMKETMKEFLSKVPVGGYFDIHLELFSNITGSAWEESLYQAYRGGAFDDKIPGIHSADQLSRSAFMEKLLNDPTIKSCLEKKCKPSDKSCKVRIQKKKKITKVVTSKDPNDITGPQGAGSQRYISGDIPLTYQISFENMADATAPAQQVVITNQLDLDKYDLATFSLGAVGFGETVVEIPAGRQGYSTQVASGLDLLVQVEASLDADTGLVTWTLTSLDAMTMLPPEDPLAGFLPPNIHSPEGQGFVFYTVSLKAGLVSDVQVKNKASIVFDLNEAIETPEWVNTLDIDAPDSSVDPLPATSPAAFTVSWAGSDLGSGVAAYDIYVSDNGGEYVPWQIGVSHTQAEFWGEDGHTYAFYSVATDQVGNLQPTPGGVQATTTVDDEASGILYLPMVVRSP